MKISRNQNQSGFIPVLLLILGLAGVLALGVGGYKYLAKNKVKNIPQVTITTQENDNLESASVAQSSAPQVASFSTTTPEVKTIIQTQKLSTEQVRLAVADEMKALLAQGLLQGPKGEKGEKGDSYADNTRGTLDQGQPTNNLGQVLGISTSSPAPLPQYAPIFYNPGNAQMLQSPTSSIGATSITAEKASFTQTATIANLAVTGSCSGCGDALAISSAVTGATAGSVFFAGTSGALNQDNANLFWNDTTNRLGIGTSTPTAKLYINSSGSGDTPLIIKTAGSAGNYTPANSGIFFYDAAGVETLRIVATDPDDVNFNSANLYIGKQAGQANPTDNVSAGFYNTGIGYKALMGNTGGYNTALGYGTLTENTSGGYNTAIGSYALGSNLTGSVNTAIGYSTMYNHTSGDHNIVMGYNTLEAESGGASNVVIGNFALRTTLTSNRNTVVGYGAMETVTPGTDIVAMGYQAGGAAGNRIIAIGRGALNGATIGDNNIGVGYGTLTSASGANNLALGYQAGNNSISGSANIIIGYDVDAPVAGSSNQLTIGNLIFGTNVNGTGTSVSAGSIGIGITSASIDTGARLHVSGSQRIDGGLCIRNATACPAYSAGRLYVDTAGTVGGDDPGDVFDIAEMYAADSVSPGDVIVVDPLVGKVKKTTEFGEIDLPSITKSKTAYTNVLGIVSTRPAIAIAGHYVVTGPEKQKENADLAQVALAGRVPVKVTTENGEIKPGDYLTSSKLFPGYAMKATRSGEVIGQALESFTSTEAGKILTFLKPGYQVINNTFVLEQEDGQLTSQLFKIETNTQDTALLVNQKGSGNLLQLQRDGTDKFVISNDGSVKILTSISEGPVFSVVNNGKTIFEINAVGDVNFINNFKLSKDNAGTAYIRAGDNQSKVIFETPYTTIPKVVVTSNDSFIPHTVVQKTENGFTIKLKEPAISDTYFDWHAFEQPEITNSESILIIEAYTAPLPPQTIQVQPLQESKTEDGAKKPESPVVSTPEPETEPKTIE